MRDDKSTDTTLGYSPAPLQHQCNMASAPLLPNTRQVRSLLRLVAVAFFMESLDTTILNTAVPVIADALHVQSLDLKSVLASYTLSLAVFIPLSGWIANRFGTRRVFCAAIVIFTLGSLLCGLCRNIHTLVISRVLQGSGGALMLPVGRLALLRSIPKADLIRAMTFVVVPGLVGPMVGPLIGGLIISNFHWSVIFFLNVPIGFACLHMACSHMPDYRAVNKTPLDAMGLALFGAGITSLSYLLEVFNEHILSHSAAALMLGASVIFFTCYGLHSRRIAHPLLELALVRHRSFRVALAGNLCTRISIGGIPFMLSLLYQVGMGFTPVQSGLAVLPQAVAAIGLKFAVPRILRKLGYRWVLTRNTVVVGCMIMAFALIDSRTPIAVIVLQSFAYGLFASLQVTAMNTLYYADIDQTAMSGATTIASTVQQLGLSFGVAVAALCATLFIPSFVHPNASRMMHGIHGALLLLGMWTALSALIYGRLRRYDGTTISRHN